MISVVFAIRTFKLGIFELHLVAIAGLFVVVITGFISDEILGLRI